MNIDQLLYRLINQTWTAKFLDIIMLYASDKFFWIPFYVLVIALLIRFYKKKSVLIIFFLFLCVLLSDRLTSGIMKPAFDRLRPCHVEELTPRIIDGIYCSDTGSMASSHAANHFGIALFMILLTGSKSRRIMAFFWLAWAFLVAYSRVYLGVHYPSDVLVGGMVGTGFGVLCHYLYLKSLKRLKWEY